VNQSPGLPAWASFYAQKPGDTDGFHVRTGKNRLKFSGKMAVSPYPVRDRRISRAGNYQVNNR
jgi:hypothetical protein